MSITPDQEQTLNDASAIAEMKETPGWKLFEKSINEALAAIDKKKGKIGRETWMQAKDGKVQTFSRSLQDIGAEYVALDEKAGAIRFIFSTVDSFEKNAEQLRKKLAAEKK